MITEFQWKGHNISINSQPALKYLWFATETAVKVDGIEIGRSGGFRITEKLIGKFPHGNNSSELALEMKADIITLVSIPYKLEIDGNIISQGRLKINNWILSFIPTLALIVCMCSIAVAFLFSTALPSFDAEAEKHFYQGIEYTRQGNNDSAKEEFTKAIEIDSTYYFAYYNRALAYYRIGDLESSLADYNKAMELQPDNVYWTIERGFLHMKLGDREKAIIDLERSQELGVPYEYKQRVEEALAQLKP